VLDHISQELLLRAIEAAPDGLLVVGDDGRILYSNEMAERMFGYEPGALAGGKVDDLVPDAMRTRHAAHRHEYMQHPRTRPMGSGLDLSARRASGDEFPVEISLSAVTIGDRAGVIAVVRDVTERRAAEKKLNDAESELALAEDRERIARDLHDTVIQRLFAIGLSLQGGLARATDDAGRERLETAIDEIDETIHELRSAIFALHRRHGAGAGVRDDVLALVAELTPSVGFEPSVRFDGLVDTEITDEVRHQLLPCLRESLTNIAKHAHATRAAIVLAVTDEVTLTVTDNGTGLGDAPRGGNGLANMNERARGLSGSCTVQRGADGGTVVEWRVPRGRSLPK
jgi:PAS domain S-box-containing protein